MMSFRARMRLLGSRKENFIFRRHFHPENGNFGPFFHIIYFWLKKVLTMVMLTYKLRLIVILSRESCIVNRQIGIGESKCEVTGDPLFTGNVNQPNF